MTESKPSESRTFQQIQLEAKKQVLEQKAREKLTAVLYPPEKPTMSETVTEKVMEAATAAATTVEEEESQPEEKDDAKSDDAKSDDAKSDDVIGDDVTPGKSEQRKLAS